MTPVELAKINHSPFPYMVVDNMLPAEIFERMKTEWPAREKFTHEDSFDRFYAFDGSNPIWDSGFWKEIGRPMLDRSQADAAERFAPYFRKRYDGPVRLKHNIRTLHEAGATFTEYTTHSHFEHNPAYAFTMLYYIDDAGDEDRGTTLYDIDLPRPLISSKWIMDYASGKLSFYKVPAVRVPFKPNSALFFVDGPTSLHGSTPFAVGTTNRKGLRKMIVVHVTNTETENDTTPGEVIQWMKLYRDTGRIAPRLDSYLDRERAVLNDWKSWEKLS